MRSAVYALVRCWIAFLRVRDGCPIQPRALVLSARSYRTHPPRGKVRIDRIFMYSHVLMETVMNSRMLM